MNQRRWISNTVIAAIIFSIGVAPLSGYAQSRDHDGGGRHRSEDNDKKDHDKRPEKKGWNHGKDPKDSGLHDNRDQVWKHKEDRPSLKKNQVIIVPPRRGHAKRGYLDSLSKQRQKTKNEWRNIAILSGAVAALGLLEKDNRLVFAGAAGALYSLDRYEKDRKSQSKIDRARASYFTKGSFTRNGKHYTRRTVKKDGKTYYQFIRK